MKNLLLLILIILTSQFMITGCDSTKRTDEPQPNYSPYTPITIEQRGDTLFLSSNHHKEYRWFDWDLNQEHWIETTTENWVVWDRKCRVRVACVKNTYTNDVDWSNIKYVH